MSRARRCSKYGRDVQGDLQRVLELQDDYQYRASPAMRERGQLIRSVIPGWLRSQATDLSMASGVEDLFVEGRDGTGRKTKVPWVRFGSRTRSPSATEGFYVVYLFDFQGEAVYLSLNQGTTDLRGGAFVRKPEEVILERRDWARSTAALWLGHVGVNADMALHDPDLGAGYEIGNVASIAYARDAIPGDAALAADVRLFAEGLKLLYQEHAIRPLPHEQPELREAEEAAERAAGRTSVPSRAGFRTSSLEIKAIEVHAVALARTYYESLGFRVRELGKPFDLQIAKGDEVLTVRGEGNYLRRERRVSNRRRGRPPRRSIPE